MTIGINVLYLIPNQVGGTEYYARSIISSFNSHTDNNTYILFCNKENAKTFSHGSKKIKIVVTSVSGTNRLFRILYEQILFPFLVKKYSCDVIYSPGYIGPALVPGIKKVVTVHDTNWKDHPEDFSFITYVATKLVTEFSMFFANSLVVSSEFSKRRLLKHFPQYKNKTKVIWPGIEDTFVAELKTAPKPKINKYFLAVSAFYPHKKILYLLELFSALKKDQLLKNYSLVLIGNNGSDKSKVLTQISKMSDVKYFSKVSYQNLISFYAHAELVIQPSIYEGFGYSVYEAIAAKKRVLVGNKNLYHTSIIKNLDQLTFSIETDCKLVKKNIDSSPVFQEVNNKFSYEKTVHDLLAVFHS